MPAEAGLSVPLPLKGLLFRFDLLAQKKLLAFRRACRTPAGLGWHDLDEIRLQTASPFRRSKANAAIAPSNECNFSFKLVHVEPDQRGIDDGGFSQLLPAISQGLVAVAGAMRSVRLWLVLNSVHWMAGGIKIRDLSSQARLNHVKSTPACGKLTQHPHRATRDRCLDVAEPYFSYAPPITSNATSRLPRVASTQGQTF